MRIADRALRTMAPPIVAFRKRLDDLLADPDVVDLSQAVPSWGPPAVAQEALARAAEDLESARYTPDPGLVEAREAVGGWMARRHGARVAAENLILTPGANAAFHVASNVLFDAGDPIHLLTPWYFNHPMTIELLGGRPIGVRIPTGVSLGEALAGGGALDVVPEGGVLVVVNPSNPTGRTFDRAELETLLAWAARRGVRLVLDETYLEFFPAGAEPATLLALDGWEEHAIVVGSASKALAITGWRYGWIAAAPSVLVEVGKVQDTAVVCAPHPAQLAVTSTLAWNGLDAWLAENRTEIGARVAAFVDELGEGGALVPEAAGAFFAWVRWAGEPGAGGPDGYALAERLAREAGLISLPGAAFGPTEGDCLRIAVGNESPERLREAARRMRGFGT